MKNKFIEPILIEVAKEFNLPLNVVIEIYESPFKFIREDIKEPDRYNVYLIHGLGKFRPTKHKMKQLKKKQDEEYRSV